ncbi:MAG TPA: hypothetical protein VHR97_01130 [Candidatus Baltobacteraceae bacterium]|nr:hypothetical protein [Candidatus Baltobacteraceae bacterium]
MRHERFAIITPALIGGSGLDAGTQSGSSTLPKAASPSSASRARGVGRTSAGR